MVRSLATKLTAAFLLVGLTGALLVAVIVRQQTQAAFGRFILDREQQSLVDYLQRYYRAFGNWDNLGEDLQLGSPPIFRSDEGRRDFRRPWEWFTLVDPEGIVVLGGPHFVPGQILSGWDTNRGIALQVNGETVGWLVTQPIPNQLAFTSPEGVFLQQVTRATLLSALIAVLLALLLGSLLAYTLTRSLREMQGAADEIAKGNLEQQVPVRSKDELGDLAKSFNKMSHDLARAIRTRRQMTADIAHDLRTPLSVIAGYTEALSDGKLPGNPETYQVLHKETQLLHHLIEDLRILSLADAGELTIQPLFVHVQQLLEQAALRHGMAAQQNGVNMRVDCQTDLPLIVVDPERMARVFDNLISNALRHTPSGGEITLTAMAKDNQINIEVRDTGSGISAEDLPRIFDRLYRGDKARMQNGESGLGLAIAKSIVEAHSGSIQVVSLPGQGSIFTIKLPISL